MALRHLLMDRWQDVSKQLEPASMSQEMWYLKKPYFQIFSKTKRKSWQISRKCRHGSALLLGHEGLELSGCHPTGWDRVLTSPGPRGSLGSPPRQVCCDPRAFRLAEWVRADSTVPSLRIQRPFCFGPPPLPSPLQYGFENRHN